MVIFWHTGVHRNEEHLYLRGGVLIKLTDGLLNTHHRSRADVRARRVAKEQQHDLAGKITQGARSTFRAVEREITPQCVVHLQFRLSGHREQQHGQRQRTPTYQEFFK